MLYLSFADEHQFSLSYASLQYLFVNISSMVNKLTYFTLQLVVKCLS